MADRRALANTAPGQFEQLPVLDRYLGAGLIGTEIAGGELELSGSNVAANMGFVHSLSPMTIDVGVHPSIEPNALSLVGDFTAPAAGYIGATISDEGITDVDGGLFIYSIVTSNRTFDQNTAPTFATMTLFSAFTTFQGNTGFSTLPPQVFFDGAVCRPVAGAGAIPDVTLHYTVSSNPQVRAQSAGDSIRVINTTGINFGPQHNTNNFFAAINHGTCRGLHARNPATVLFGQAIGVELLDAYYGVDVDNITLDTTKERAAVRSAITAAATHYFLLNNGGAQSDFGGGTLQDCGNIFLPADLRTVNFGAANDVALTWGGTRFAHIPLVGDILRFDYFAGGITIDSPGFGVGGGAEMRWGYDRFAFGQTSALGNGVGLFVSNARSSSVAGGWTDWLQTAAANLTVDDALAGASTWAVNPLSFTAGTGSLTGFVATLELGGMTTAFAGLGTPDTAALRVTGRHTQRGVPSYEPILPAQITANQTAYTGWGAGNAQREWLITDSDIAGRLIQGIDSTLVQDGDKRTFTNDGAFGIGFTDLDGAAAAADQIITGTGGTVTVATDNSIQLRYDGSAAKWRIIH